MTGTGGDTPRKHMTIRISRDNGRTYTDPIDVQADPNRPPSNAWAEGWPPCQCPKHRAARAEGREITQAVRLRFDGS
ncbi:hypothetical protein HRW16_19695 [Streptomyces lunaelactis]|uniref:hypothetical protein n=1 Tax=Streptomyces lunaelactis TaxID=1535768 RepID=UPI0015851348|nr:hypothetical protein [Streptomyces lunaelactis]NUK94016.1 hypothetical protein [Streptomyces lunaelactis]